MASRQGLGRGLSALLGDENSSVFQQGVLYVELQRVRSNASQPRSHFDEETLRELSKSIEKHGIVQPLIVRRSEGGHYDLVAGERRWRAAGMAGIHKVPVIVQDVDDRALLEIALIENIQREDLNAVEEARAYQMLIREHGYSQVVLAENLGKSRSHIANLLRLLRLEDEVQDMLIKGQISMGHARALVGCSDALSLAHRVVRSGWNVRTLEDFLARRRDEVEEKSVSKPKRKHEEVRRTEKALKEAWQANSVRLVPELCKVSLRFEGPANYQRFLRHLLEGR